uniref:Tudor domain-containing protein 7 n=1 Tax=Panagrellus redivivus TaxID=6233 RepID=A0A7E4V275_PANRE
MSQSYRAQIGELDVSEEAEEAREFLYAIVSEYPTGIDAVFLHEQYNKKYVETGIANELPRDWLKQLQLAGEFEVKELGGSATVYIVHKDAIILPDLVAAMLPRESEKPLNVDSLSQALPEVKPATNGDEPDASTTTSPKADILSISHNGTYFYARFEKDNPQFDAFVKKMTQYYTEHHKTSNVAVDAVEVNKLYAVLDAACNWSRVLVKDLACDSSILPCFFIDYGELRSAVRSSLKQLDSTLSVDVIPAFAKCCAVKNLINVKPKDLVHSTESICDGTTLLKKIDPINVQLKTTSHDDVLNYDVVTVLAADGSAGNLDFLNTAPISAPGISATSPTVVSVPTPATNLNITCRDPKEMPTKKEVVHIISATDPDNISIRLENWYPAPDYLYAAMARDSENSPPPPKEIIEVGKYFAAKLEDTWERVQIIRPSTTDTDYWIVYAVDIGYFHLVHRSQLRQLTEAVSKFNRILLAKCRLNGIKPNESGVWSRELQTAMQDILLSATKSTVEFVPDGEWTFFESFNAPKLPYATGTLKIDGKDFAEYLVSLGLAEKA